MGTRELTGNGQANRAAGGRLVTPALVAVCTGYFMVILDTTVVNVALPALRGDLGAGVTGLQWVVDSYLLVLAAGLLSGGAVADRHSARRVFQIGLGVFVAASAGCGLAPGVAALVAARVAQGIGAALAVPASLALLRASFTGRALRARAVGVWGAVAGVAAVAGPTLGGLLVSAAGWRLVFFVNVPIGLGAMVLTARFVTGAGGTGRRLDPPGQLLGILALAALALALIEGGHAGGPALVVAAAVACSAAVAGFVVVEHRVAAPMLPLGLFREATFTGAAVVGLLINLGFYGQLFVLNLYFQSVRGDSAVVAGLAVLPQMGVVALGSALSGRFTARAGGPRATMLVGLAAGGAGMLGLLATGSHTPYSVLIAPLLAAGFGMSFTMPAVTTAVTDAAPAQHSGLAAGVINASRQVGSVVGVALLGGLVSRGSAFLPGMHVAVAIAGGAFLSGAALTLATVHRRRAPAAC